MRLKSVFQNTCVLLIFLLGLSACENDIALVNSITAEDELPVESGKNVEYIYSDSAIIRAKVTAPQLDRYLGKKNYMEMPKGMHVIFYNTKQEVETNLTADYGIGYDNGTGISKMEARRNVCVINEKGERLNTEHLIWDAVTKKIYTEEFVKITTKDEVLFGNGLTADQDFSKYTIHHLTGTLSINDSDSTNQK